VTLQVNLGIFNENRGLSFSPNPLFLLVFSRATDQSRTDDLRFTKASLYQLSYGGGWNCLLNCIAASAGISEGEL